MAANRRKFDEDFKAGAVRSRTALALVFSSYLLGIAPSFPTKEVRIKPGTVQRDQVDPNTKHEHPQ